MEQGKPPLLKVSISAPKQDGLKVLSPSPRSPGTSAEELAHRDQYDAMQWRIEAMRLSQRIMELELENARMRSSLSNCRKHHDFQPHDVPVESANHHRAQDPGLVATSGMRHSWSVSKLEDLKASAPQDAPVRIMLKHHQPALVHRSSLSESDPEGVFSTTSFSSLVSSQHSSPTSPNVPPLPSLSEDEDETPTPPLSRSDYSESDGSQVSIWVGTWNMGAMDPFADRHGLLDEQNANVMTRNFVPHGYDLYIVGLQEAVSENVYHCILAFLNRNAHRRKYVRMRLQNNAFRLPDKSHPPDASLDAVKGRGDGAFVGTKFTGIAVFATVQTPRTAPRTMPSVTLLRSAVHKFNIASGSKGGVVVGLRVGSTTLAFVNCHLDARHESTRREQIRVLNTTLGKHMGQSPFDLTDQFHHVIWMGDLNYRIHTLDGDTVMHMLGEGRNVELHNTYDGLLADRLDHPEVFQNFIEPEKWPDFYPTYKKYEHRGLVDTEHSSWPSVVYRTQYKEPFYKGGQVKSRVPGWCDRILVHSMKDDSRRNGFSSSSDTRKRKGSSISTLVPEQVVHPSLGLRKRIDNYRSINDGVGMDISDHSPVCCSFILHLDTCIPHEILGPRMDELEEVSSLDLESPPDVTPMTRMIPVQSVLRVFNLTIRWGTKAAIIPKKMRVVVPLMGEDDIPPCDTLGERSVLTNGTYAIQAKMTVVHTQALEKLHLLLWVKFESIVGHCVISLDEVQKKKTTASFEVEDFQDFQYTDCPLYSRSSPVLHENHPVMATFSLRNNIST